MFKRKGGGGVKGLLNNVKKNCTFLKGWLPLSVDVDGAQVYIKIELIISYRGLP